MQARNSRRLHFLRLNPNVLAIIAVLDVLVLRPCFSPPNLSMTLEAQARMQ